MWSAVAAQAYPDSEDALTLNAEVVRRYDSNPFNLPDAVSPQTVLGRDSRADWLTRAEVSATGQLKWSLQRLSLQGHYADTRYSQMRGFDHADRDGLLTWDWQVGADWQGRAQLSDARARVEFDPLRPGQAEALQTRNRLLSGRWQPQSNWWVTLGAQQSERDYETRQQLDAQERQLNVGLDWKSPVGPLAGVEVREIDTDYRSDWSGETAAQRETRLRRVQLTVGWLASTGYQLTLRGIQQRWEKPAAGRNESAQGAVFTGSWQSSPLWQGQISLTRMTELPEGELEPARQSSAQIHLQWLPTARLTFVFDGADTRRQRDSQPGPALNDRVRSLSTGVDWQWMDSLTLGIRLSKQQRKYASSSYDSTASQGEASVRWLF